MFDLNGKRAYITGGSSGIGRAVAEAFVARGAEVVIADIVDASTAAAEIGARHLHCNVADEQSVRDSLVSACNQLDGALDIVVLNAGVGDVGPSFEETGQDLLEKVTRVNQWGLLYGLKHAPQHMRDGGSIIATSSMASKMSIPGTGVYSAAKAAVNSMVSMAALELGARAIRVNALCPGYVSTAMGSTPEEVRCAETMTALGRHGEPAQDIAPVFVFFAADASRYITGQALSVDAGMQCGATPQLLELVTGAASAPGSR